MEKYGSLIAALVVFVVAVALNAAVLAVAAYVVFSVYRWVFGV